MLAQVTKKRMMRIHLSQSASGPAVRSLARSAAERTRERTGMMKRAERVKLSRTGRWLTRLVLVRVVPSFILLTRSLFPAGLNYRRLVPRSDQVQTWVEF
jgi:hypothetical protein